MNMDNLDPGTLDQNVQEFGQPKRRGWWSRNWLWFVPTVLLAMVLLCCGCPAGIALWFLGHIFEVPPLQEAMQKIQSNEAVTQELGQPITPVYVPPPSFQGSDREIEWRWFIRGPKGQATAHIKTRPTGGRFETVVLEVSFANGKKISIAEEGGNEAPKFVLPKAEDKKSESNAPAPEINLPTFPDDGPGKK